MKKPPIWIVFAVWGFSLVAILLSLGMRIYYKGYMDGLRACRPPVSFDGAVDSGRIYWNGEWVEVRNGRIIK